MKKKIENPLFVPAPEPTDFCASHLLTCFVFFDHSPAPGPIAAATFTRSPKVGIWIKEPATASIGANGIFLNAAMGPDDNEFSFSFFDLIFSHRFFDVMMQTRLKQRLLVQHMTLASYFFLPEFLLHRTRHYHRSWQARCLYFQSLP